MIPHTPWRVVVSCQEASRGTLKPDVGERLSSLVTSFPNSQKMWARRQAMSEHACMHQGWAAVCGRQECLSLYAIGCLS